MAEEPPFPSQDEIVARIKERRRAEDVFGFEISEYLDWLDFDHAKQFLKDGVTAAEWIDRPFAPTRERVIQAIRDYMPFAWEKANNQRGISAGRSIMQIQAWLWLLDGREREMAPKLSNYSDYGKPQLRAICEHFAIPYGSLDQRDVAEI